MEQFQVVRVEDAARELAINGFHLYPQQQWRLPGHVTRHWRSLAESWNDMPRDPYMADNGTYRERRYGKFLYDCTTGQFSPSDNTCFYQSPEINKFAGGIERHFEPLAPATAANRLLHYLIESGIDHFSRSFRVAETLWEIGVHQFRIIARDGQAGLPAPEGVHSDGHDFLSIHLIGRDNVEGGVSTVYAPDGAKLAETTLRFPLDSMFVNDRAVLHDVSPVTQADPSRPGIRDMLVIDYNLMSA